MVLTLDIFDFVLCSQYFICSFTRYFDWLRKETTWVVWPNRETIKLNLSWNGIKRKKNIKQTNTATNVLEMNAGIILKLLNEKETVFYHLTQYSSIAWIIFELPDNRNGPSNDSLNIAFNFIIFDVVCWDSGYVWVP